MSSFYKYEGGSALVPPPTPHVLRVVLLHTRLRCRRTFWRQCIFLLTTKLMTVSVCRNTNTIFKSIGFFVQEGDAVQYLTTVGQFWMGGGSISCYHTVGIELSYDFFFNYDMTL